MESFACGHFSPIFADALTKALGEVSLQPSVFGRGEDTVFDKSVRNSSECHAAVVQPVIDQVCPSWYPLVVRPAINAFAAITGITGPCEAELHKLLVYGQGGLFDWHVDTPKTPSMVGTLVVSLEVTGDAHLELRTEAGEAKVTTGPAQWAAFSASTHHRVPPLPEGATRKVLVYNISVHPPTPAAEAPATTSEHKTVVPGVLYILSHRYPPKQFGMMDAVAVGRDRVLYNQMCSEFGKSRISVLKARKFACVALSLRRYMDRHPRRPMDSWEAVMAACREAQMDFEELNAVLPGYRAPAVTDRYHYYHYSLYMELGFSYEKATLVGDMMNNRA